MQRRGTIICLTYKDKSLLLPEEGGLVLPHVKLRVLIPVALQQIRKMCIRM
jgi:hypothetical protein